MPKIKWGVGLIGFSLIKYRQLYKNPFCNCVAKYFAAAAISVGKIKKISFVIHADRFWFVEK
jgi:hypothetical protein